MTSSQRDSVTHQVVVARGAFESGRTKNVSWRRAQLTQLIRMLDENVDEIEKALAADLGRHPFDAYVTEVMEPRTEARHVLRHLSKWTSPKRVRSLVGVAPSTARIRREPLGTVLIISPWNYPVHLLLMPLIGAVAAGNAAVLKPSELAPESSRLMARLLPEYLDPEAVQVVEGGIEETTTLLDQRWDHIFYTGSTRVGSVVMSAAARHVTPVTLELGGKSPVWVDETFPIKLVARWLVWGKFVNAGQTCVAPDYVLTTRGNGQRLARAIASELDRVYGPDPKASADYGRIVNESHARRLSRLLTCGTVAVGGQVDIADRYVSPTVLLDVTFDDPVMDEEIFGPILPVLEVADHVEAIRAINAREKPLALYAFTRNRGVKDALLNGTSSGGVTFGGVMLHVGIPSLPFGGVGSSGTGSYHGEHSLRTFSHERAVLDKGRGPDLARLARAPFTPFKERLLRRR